MQPDIPTFLNVRLVMSYFLFPQPWPDLRQVTDETKHTPPPPLEISPGLH